jgi:hypothetical protein
MTIKGFSTMSRQYPDPDPAYLTNKLTEEITDDETAPRADRQTTRNRRYKDEAWHRRITQPLNNQGERGRLLRELRQQAEEQRETPTLPEAVTEAANEGSLSFTYILSRLNRSICQAQDSGNYREAIRLQLLQWYMQDERLSPVQVARKAWLVPAAG